MDKKFLCGGYDCPVYVFGHSSGGKCPECGVGGVQVSAPMAKDFLEWYEAARARPTKEVVE